MYRKCPNRSNLNDATAGARVSLTFLRSSFILSVKPPHVHCNSLLLGRY